MRDLLSGFYAEGWIQIQKSGADLLFHSKINDHDLKHFPQIKYRFHCDLCELLSAEKEELFQAVLFEIYV